MSAARSNPLSALLIGPPSPSLSKLAARLQSLPGWEVSLAQVQTPAEALASLRENLRDLVFLENPLPGADALLLLSQIRQLHPKTAVVVVTAGAGEAAAVAFMKGGAMDYLGHDALDATDFGAMGRRVHELRYLVDQNAELRQVNQMKNEFIANVSHELRTPLSVIIGFADSLKSGSLGPVSSPQLKALEAITGRAEELLRTLNQILRIGEGQRRMLLKPLDLRALVQEEAARPARELGRKKMAVECRLPQEAVWVRGDEEKLSIVVENLIANAIKFGQPSSTVTITVTAQHADGSATLAVRDEGPGVPLEMLPRLFESFGAAVNGPTREYGGLGLGLSLSKRIVEQHGGRIWLESKDRRGCTAYVTLPLSLADSPPVPVAIQPGMDKKRVLIVEDNPEIVDVLLLFMSNFSANLELSAARSGFEALEKVKDQVPDLIILDVVMPGMDGYEVLDRLRRAEATSKLPVLVLTGYADAAKKARERGAQEVLLKPFDRKAFCAKITQMLCLEQGAPAP
jgi:signal transduction histidine kinase